MPLIEDLGLSLKDFLPQDGARVIRDRSGRVALISTRLHDELQAHAVRNGIPLGAVIEQLRDEVHEVTR